MALPSETCSEVSMSQDFRKQPAYIAKTDILHQSGVKVRLLNYFLQDRVYQEIQLCVLEASLASLCQRRPYGEGNHHVVSILGGATKVSKWRLFGFSDEPTLHSNRRIRERAV